MGVLVKHVDGTFLITKRDKGKVHGEMWEATCGGSAILGETICVLFVSFMQCRANTRDFSHEIQSDIYFTKKYHISKICGIIHIQEYLFPSLRKEKTVCI